MSRLAHRRSVMAPTRRPASSLAGGYPPVMGNDMRFQEQDSGVPTTTPERNPDPALPARSAPTDPDAAAGAGPDPSPSAQSGIPSEGVSQSSPGDGL